MKTWRKEITSHMAEYGDDWSKVVGWAHPGGDAGFDVEFDEDSGSPVGDAFTVWTADRVYFPATYDGFEWVDSVPRNPCDEATDHVGC